MTKVRLVSLAIGAFLALSAWIGTGTAAAATGACPSSCCPFCPF